MAQRDQDARRFGDIISTGFGAYYQEQDRLRQEQKQRQEQERQMEAQKAQFIQQRVPGLMQRGQWDELARLQGDYSKAIKTAYDVDLPAPAVGAPVYGPQAPAPQGQPIALPGATRRLPSYMEPMAGPLTQRQAPGMGLPEQRVSMTTPPLPPRQELRRDFSGPQSIQAMRNLFAPEPPPRPDLVLSYKPDGTATYVRKELGATIRPEPRIPATRMFQDYDPVTGRVTLVPGAPGTVLTPRPSMQLSYSPEGTQATVVPMVPGAQVGVRQPATIDGMTQAQWRAISTQADRALNNIEMTFPGALSVLETGSENGRLAYRIRPNAAVAPISFIQRQFESRGFNIRQLPGGDFVAVAGAATRAGLPAPKPTPPQSRLTTLRIEDLENKIFKDYVAQRDINLWNRIQGKQFAMIQPDDQMKLDVIKEEFNKRPGVKPAAASSGPSTRPLVRPSAPPGILPKPPGGPGVDIDSIRDVLRSQGEQ
jgi:hypothetical protein